MEKSTIRTTLERLAYPLMDIDYHLSILTSYEENKWFQPNNSSGHDYDVCKTLSEIGLVEQMRTPIWVDGVFRGVTVSFRYNIDLKY